MNSSFCSLKTNLKGVLEIESRLCQMLLMLEKLGVQTAHVIYVSCCTCCMTNFVILCSGNNALISKNKKISLNFIT